jgi:hypothetical protein
MHLYFMANLARCYQRGLEAIREPLSPSKTPASSLLHLPHSFSHSDWNFREWKPSFQKEKMTWRSSSTSRGITFVRRMFTILGIYLSRFWQHMHLKTNWYAINKPSHEFWIGHRTGRLHIQFERKIGAVIYWPYEGRKVFLDEPGASY